MKYERITKATLNVLRKLPVNLSTESVAMAYNIDPAIVELERPKPKIKAHDGPEDRGIPSDSSHRQAMREGSERLLAALHAAYSKRHWADPHGWGAVYCGMRP